MISEGGHWQYRETQRFCWMEHQELDSGGEGVSLVLGALWASPWLCWWPSWLWQLSREPSRAEAAFMPYVSPVASALPVSFQELEDSKWGALTAGLGDGWMGMRWLSISSRWHLAGYMHLWHCIGMRFRERTLCDKIVSFRFEGGWFDWFLML